MEYEADKLATKIIQKVSQNYKSRDALFEYKSEKKTIKPLGSTRNQKFIDISQKYFLPTNKGSKITPSKDYSLATKS